MKKPDFDLSNIVCINFDSHNEEQLHSVAITYNLSFDYLLEAKKSGVKKAWLPKGGGWNVAILETKNIEDIYFFPHYLPMTARTKKAILAIKPVKTPKKPKQLSEKVTDVEENKIQVSTSLNVDQILDKINSFGMSSLTTEELNFLKNIK